MVVIRPAGLNEKVTANPRFVQEVLPFLAPAVSDLLRNLPTSIWSELEELRLRVSRPLLMRLGLGELTLNQHGEICRNLSDGVIISREMVDRSLQMITASSIYACEEELKNGFLTIRGGHRVGVTGKVVLEAGRVKTIRYVSSLNVRMSREIKGVGRQVLPYLIHNSQVVSTLIVSPPQAGKTTLLRDIIRLLSDGDQKLGYGAVNVGVVDERSELAGCWQGVPQNDLGRRVDVLDACPKAEGMLMLLRAMAPQVIVTDELGRESDLRAVQEAVSGGVAIITSVHGLDEQDIRRKPVLRAILDTGVFQRIIVLSRRLGVGTLEKILDSSTNRNLLSGGPKLLTGRC